MVSPPDTTWTLRLWHDGKKGKSDAEVLLLKVDDDRSGLQVLSARITPQQWVTLQLTGEVSGVDGYIQPLGSLEPLGNYPHGLCLDFPRDFDGQGADDQECYRLRQAIIDLALDPAPTRVEIETVHETFTRICLHWYDRTPRDQFDYPGRRQSVLAALPAGWKRPLRT